MFVSIKSLHVSVFFHDHLQWSSAVLCAVTIPPADLRSLSLYYYAVCGRMCMSSVCVWCSCLYNLNERKSAGGIVTAQSTAEDHLKMVVKKDRNM